MLRHNGAKVIGVSPMKAPNGGSSGSAIDALPKQFVASMKTLFDILDDQRTGLVRFADIERGWQDDGCKGLPCGVIDSLRKVTPANGLLSFERFCAGLKLCLLRNQAYAGNGPGPTPPNLNVMPYNSSKTLPRKATPRPPSAPVLEIENPRPAPPWSVSETATMRLQNITAQQRTLSMPQLSPDSEVESEDSPRIISTDIYNSPPPPPKPPRASVANNNAVNAASTMLASTRGIGNGPPPPPPSIPLMDKAEIRQTLQNWQMGILLNEMDEKEKQRKLAFLEHQQLQLRGSADGGSSSTTDSINGNASTLYAKKSSSKRREPRRHTLQNGIDYNTLKRLKQLEEERDVLLLGLNAVDKAREWYLQQLSNVQEKIKYLGRMGHVEQWSEVQQERLNFQRGRVLEINRNLAIMADSWESGGFPLQFNLTTRKPSNSNVSATRHNGGGTNDSALLPLDLLHQQNRHLINEVNLKSDRITLLEREKQTLLHELYEMQRRTNLGITGHAGQHSGRLGDADVVY